METIEVYFDDLTNEKQQALLDTFDIADPADMNWDVFPLTLVALPKENGVQDADTRSGGVQRV